MRRIGLCLLLLPCLGFHWPGQVYRIQHELQHADPEQRRELVRSLGEHGAEEARDALLLSLDDADSAVRLEAAAVAGRVRLREAVPVLLDWLDDKEADTRRSAADALGNIGEARALPALTRALGDAAAEVRRAAVIALGKIGTPESVTPLLGRLEDVDLSVRIEAIAALGALHDGRALAPLLGSMADSSPEVRVATLEAFGRIRDARALPALARALADDDDQVRLAAAAALGRLGDAGGVGPLKTALERAEPRLAQAAVAALSAIDDDKARAVLIAQLQVPALRLAATRALLAQARRLQREARVGVGMGAGAGAGADAGTGRGTGRGAGAGTTTGAGAEGLVAQLGVTLRGAEPGAKLAIVRALTTLAQVASLEPALDALLAELPAAQGELGAALLQALGASAAPAALMPLLERLGQGEGKDAQQAVLDALQAYFEHAEPDGRAADPLLGRLDSAQGAQRIEVVQLLGRVRAPRALPALTPLLAATDPVLRLAAVRALGEIGVPEAAPALLPLLDNDDARTRFEAANALRATADAGTVHALLERLDAERRADRHALLIALGGALGRLAHAGKLPQPLAQRALQSLARQAQNEDPELADRAVEAIALFGPEGAIEQIATILRVPSSRRRAAAVAALGQLGDARTRPLLRYLLDHGSVHEAVAAAAALGETGDQRDVRALIRSTKRLHWPVPGAAAYALARMAQRGVLKPHLSARELCALGRSREPYVRANVAAALAALGAGACDHGPDPLSWLEPEHAPIVRAAAARWAYTAAAAGHLDGAKVSFALEACAATDLEPSVRAACAEPPRSARREPTEVYAYGGGGVRLLRETLVALRLADATVFLGYTDANAHLRLPAAPQGELRLEDPGLVPLEPPGQDEQVPAAAPEHKQEHDKTHEQQDLEQIRE